MVRGLDTMKAIAGRTTTTTERERRSRKKVNSMRGRGYGRGIGASNTQPGFEPEPGYREAAGEGSVEKETVEKDVDKPVKEEKRSWMNVATGCAQLTLDVIRVIREATDLYRKLRAGT